MGAPTGNCNACKTGGGDKARFSAMKRSKQSQGRDYEEMFGDKPVKKFSSGSKLSGRSDTRGGRTNRFIKI